MATPPAPATTPVKSTTEPNNERSAVVLALFGPSVGPCVGDFSTTYNRVNGRLYASTKAILFYSNLFGFERRLCLQLNDVEIIEAYRATSIRVLLVDCEDYIFRRFSNRDSVLSLLQQLLREHDYPSGAGNNTTILTRELSLPVSDETEGSDFDLEGPLRPHLNSEIIPEPVAIPPPAVDPSPRDSTNDRNSPRPRARARSVPPPKRRRKFSSKLSIGSPGLRRTRSTFIESTRDSDDSSPVSMESRADSRTQVEPPLSTMLTLSANGRF